MRVFYSELSSSAQTAYAQLVDAALVSQHVRSVADLSGSFASKTVKGNKYWYYQYSEPSGKLRQVFVGPDTEAVNALVARKLLPSVAVELGQLSGAAVALGCTEVLPKHLRVIRRLAEYGFFGAGGVLVGTHAFLTYGNMLGVRWGDASRTQDIDFAHDGKNLSLALPSNIEVQTRDAIESLQMGLLPVSGLSGKSGATYLSPRDPAFRLDFLTTLRRGGAIPYEHPQLHVMLQPLKFMEFSLVQVQQAVVFNSGDAILVNVPHPARYALHKLLIHGEREGTFAAKSGKDLMQAASLLALLKERRKWEVEQAWADMISRGRGWSGRIKRGINALDRQYPEFDIKTWLRS